MKSSTHVISQKNLDEVFDSNKHSYVEKKTFVEKLCCKTFVPKSILHVYKKLVEIKEKLPPQ